LNRSGRRHRWFLRRITNWLELSARGASCLRVLHPISKTGRKSRHNPERKVQTGTAARRGKCSTSDFSKEILPFESIRKSPPNEP
jgi:hypothetical protein